MQGIGLYIYIDIAFPRQIIIHENPPPDTPGNPTRVFWDTD